MKIIQALNILRQIPSHLPVFTQIANKYGAGDTNIGFSTTYYNEKLVGFHVNKNRMTPTHDINSADIKLPTSTVCDVIVALEAAPIANYDLDVEGIYCLDTRVEMVLT